MYAVDRMGRPQQAQPAKGLDIISNRGMGVGERNRLLEEAGARIAAGDRRGYEEIMMQLNALQTARGQTQMVPEVTQNPDQRALDSYNNPQE